MVADSPVDILAAPELADGVWSVDDVPQPNWALRRQGDLHLCPLLGDKVAMPDLVVPQQMVDESSWPPPGLPANLFRALHRFRPPRKCLLAGGRRPFSKARSYA